MVQKYRRWERKEKALDLKFTSSVIMAKNSAHRLNLLKQQVLTDTKSSALRRI